MSSNSPTGKTANGAENSSSGRSEDFLDGAAASEELAYELARSDAELIHELREARRARGITEAQLAASLGISVGSIRAFEGGQMQPTLAGIRRYAHSIGVLVSHRVEPFEQGQLPAEDEQQDSEGAEDDAQELNPAAEAIRAAKELQAERIVSALAAVRDHTVDHGEEFQPLSTRILSILPEHIDSPTEEQKAPISQEEHSPRDPSETLLELRELLTDYSRTPAAIYHSYHIGRLQEMLAQLSVQA